MCPRELCDDAARASCGRQEAEYNRERREDQSGLSCTCTTRKTNERLIEGGDRSAPSCDHHRGLITYVTSLTLARGATYSVCAHACATRMKLHGRHACAPCAATATAHSTPSIGRVVARVATLRCTALRVRPKGIAATGMFATTNSPKSSDTKRPKGCAPLTCAACVVPDHSTQQKRCNPKSTTP